MTWNPADTFSGITLSGGNLIATRDGVTTDLGISRGQAFNSGKRCFEVEWVTLEPSPFCLTGLMVSGSDPQVVPQYPGDAENGWGYFSGTGQLYSGGFSSVFGATYTDGDVVTVYVDFDAGKAWFALNGTVQAGGDPEAGTSPAFTFDSGLALHAAIGLYRGGSPPYNQAIGRFAADDIEYPIDGFGDWQEAESVTGTAAAVASVTAVASGYLAAVGAAVAIVAVAAQGIGSIVITGEGAANVSVAAAGVGGPPIEGYANASIIVTASAEGEAEYSFGAGVASVDVGAAGIATAFPAGVVVAPCTITGAGIGAVALSGTASAVPIVSAAAVGGHGVSGSAACSVTVYAAGGDWPTGSAVAQVVVTAASAGRVQPAAAGVWLYLHTTPPAQIYQRDELRARLAPGRPMLRIPFSVSPTAAQLGQQNEAFSLTLDRPSDRLRARLAAQGPYGVRVDVMDGGEISRSGIITGVDGLADGGIAIDCEGQGWAADLPLRTSADFGSFREVLPLPWRFGRAVPGRLVRLDNTGSRWLWADHASSSITSLTADGQPYDGWTWRNEVDGNGHPYTLVETVDAFDEGAELVATGDGALDPLSGTLMTNPADVVYALCTYAGRSVDRGALVPFRIECLGRGLEVSGSIDGGTLQAALTSIAESIYAAFGRATPGLMRLRPRTGALAAIPAQDTPAASALRETLVTRLRVRYALEDGKPRGSVEIRAPGIEALRGSTVAEVTLPWVRDERSAVDVASRMLADRARPRYVVQSAHQRRRWLPGDVATVSVGVLALSGEALVEASTIDETGSTPRLVIAVGSSPATEIVGSATAYTPQTYTGATVAAVGTDRIIAITDQTGRPISGAQCTLDGGIVRTADGAGRVAFPFSLMPPGAHVIDVTAQGFEPFRLSMTV